MSKEKIEEIKQETAKVKGKSFNEIITTYQRIAWELENGEITDEILEDLQANEQDAETKLLGMYYVIQMNTAKIDNFYKLEIESASAKIKRLNKANGILKENCMQIAELYGKQNKYISLNLNCSKVTKEILSIDEVPFETRVLEIRDIINGMREDDTTVDEFNCFSTDFTLKNLDIADAIKVRKLLLEAFPNKEVIFNPTLDKKAAFELVKSIPDDIKEGDQVSIFNTTEKPTLGIKGISKGYTYFPRFS